MIKDTIKIWLGVLIVKKLSDADIDWRGKAVDFLDWAKTKIERPPQSSGTPSN